MVIDLIRGKKTTTTVCRKHLTLIAVCETINTLKSGTPEEADSLTIWARKDSDAMPLIALHQSGDISKMDTITENEKGRKSVSHVSENVVQIDHVTLNKATNSRYQCRWIFDFTDVSRKELEIMAARKLVIDYRVPFKTVAAHGLDGLDNQTFMVREILSSTPQRLDPVSKARKALIALSPEDIAELLAERAELHPEA